MKNFDKFNDRCPPVVHERILFTLNGLPNIRTQKKKTVRASVLAAAAVLVALFMTLWAINPALADGNTFRSAVSEFLGFNPSAREIVEPPLAAQKITELPIVKEPEQTALLNATAVLTQPDKEGGRVPTALVSGYIFELEPETLYDGVTLVVGYNVRREDGEPMPPEEEYTKIHLAGFIRTFEVLIDGEMVRLENSGNEFDWSDPYVYRQITSYDLRKIDEPITDETEITLRIAVHEYGEKPQDTITTFADLPFSVNTSHEDNANIIIALETVFSRGDFTVELMPITHSAARTLIVIRAYKQDDPQFGKRMDGHLSINVKDMNGNILTPPQNTCLASMGHREDETGFTYMEYEWNVDPLLELPESFQLTFGRGDAESATNVDYEPIIIHLP